MTSHDIREARLALTGDGPLVVLSGAGMSAESGVPTFRDAQTGLWERYDPTELATPEAWRRSPETAWAWYRWRERLVSAAQPNAGHLAVARAAADREVVVVTQNVDDLHERAGARRVLHMHGEHLNAWCTTCGERSRWTGPMIDRPACPACDSRSLRPDVVWFGEMPYRMDEIYDALRNAHLFVSIGTSGAVYPAAGFVRDARSLGVATLELNLERSQGSGWFDETRLGRASELVPRWVDEVLAR